MNEVVLLVEDDEDIRIDLAAVLEDHGYRVVTAQNGLDALRYLGSQEPPCLILLDLMMPVMNGWQFCLELLRNEALRSIPVVLLSGAGGLSTEVAALGAVGYVSKPIDLSLLFGFVQRHCGHPRSSPRS